MATVSLPKLHTLGPPISTAPQVPPGFFHHPQQSLQTTRYQAPFQSSPPYVHYPSSTGYHSYMSAPLPDTRLPPPLSLLHHTGSSHKRLAPPHPHPSESPAKKKQSKWTADEDAAIIELRGNGMKWEDISKHLPSRSAISCRLRFQNYLERRSEWDEEKKNKLARLYERFKKDMWEKISKEMQLPWRAAEAMHWQIGEIEMAQRANVPVFHLAGQQVPVSASMGPGPECRSGSTSPQSSSAPSSALTFSHTYNNNSLVHVSPSQSHLRRSSLDESSGGPSMLRRRADSVTGVPLMNTHLPTIGTLLPPLVDVSSHPGATRYKLPPVKTSPDLFRR